jgi:hypothetical protein
MEAQNGDRLVQGPKKGQLKSGQVLKLEHGGKGRRKQLPKVAVFAEELLVSDSIFAKPD